jgi:hypothetical protein
MTNITELIETEFINWLYSKADDEIVGRPKSVVDCLLTRFLGSNSIRPEAIWYEVIISDYGTYPIPEQISNFIRKVADTHCALFDYKTTVTAKQAKSVWEEMDNGKL